MNYVDESSPISQDEAEKEPNFFSLKWKVMLLFSLVLLIINAGLAGMGYLQQSGLFETYQEQIRDQQNRQVKSLLDTSFFRLEQIALMIPSLAEVATESNEVDISLSDKLHRFFIHSATTLEMEWGLEEAAYYSRDNKLQFNWQLVDQNGALKELTETVNRLEMPMTMLQCHERCHQYVAAPLLYQGEYAGVILVGRSLADVIIEFNELAKTDIAVISHTDNAKNRVGRSRYLNEWQRYISASSNIKKLLPLFHDTARKIELKALLESNYTTTYKGDYYSFTLIPANSDTSAQSADFILVSNITPVVHQIQEATIHSVLIGLLGFFLSELLLATVLWHPMKRLLMISDSLPLLAKSAYEQVRQTLSIPHYKRYQDEIDVASDSAIELTYTLESLNKEIEHNTNSLINRSKQLAQERDFLSTIMNNAQVIILTQDCDGAILTMNTEGCNFIGIKDYRRGSGRFGDLFMNTEIAGEMQPVLTGLRQGMINVYQHDASAFSSDGQNKTISWVHSSLASKPTPDTPVVLSVGLDITDREVAEQRLTWLANHDPLTELNNRRYFQSEFEKMITLAERYHHASALLFFDLDQFKYINDSSGHHTGDALLQIVARKLREITRSTDLIARLGGDEFAIVIPEADISAATRYADKLLMELRKLTIPLKGLSHRVSASIGIVAYPNHGKNANELLSNADLAMYQAKESGRDRWHLFSSSELAREQMNASATWKDKIEQALTDDRFILYFQPIMEISSATITHYEVLIRMVEKDGSISMPGEFIPVAERTGLIHRINHFVLNASITKLADLNNNNIDITFSINLSGRVIDDPELLPQLTQLLNTSGIDPKHLVFELTETAALADVNAAEHLMTALQALGCRFALDDFGVGFSSFYYLRELPLDIVKIDGSFIKQLPTNSMDQVFVKALTEMATALGKQTIAEFVEDEATLKLLGEIGVNYAQGYYVGRPSPMVPIPQPNIEPQPQK
ncbi:MAG: EAL domain-containing protein [Candidatus Thiodiazotropha sp.]|jgi:diguanylate cyclase (GGDEF)-like protein/PAS domain S-box-containing protein